MKTGIYLIKNKLNGHCYVGQSLDIEERWKQHIAAAKRKSSQAIHKAIAKYSPENFEFSILEECSANELDAREIHWIKELDTYNNGYNLTLGGGGSNQGKDRYSAEYKRAASKKRYEANKDDPEFKKKHNDSSKAWYEANKDDPEFKKKECERSKAYREANKEQIKAYREANKEQIKAYNKEYYEAHKLKPTPDHTDMPLW